MEAFLAGRSKLSFVKTTVLTSKDGGNTFEDERVQEVVDDEGNQLSQSEVAALKTPDVVGSNLTLFEQLQKNKEDKDQLWQEKHGTHAPKALDEEDVMFLNQEAQRQTSKRRERKEEEERELAKFHAERQRIIAQKKKGVSQNNAVAQKRMEVRVENKKRALLGTKRKVLPSMQRQGAPKVVKNAAVEKKIVDDGAPKDDKPAPKASSGTLDFLSMYGDDDSDSD